MYREKTTENVKNKLESVGQYYIFGVDRIKMLSCVWQILFHVEHFSQTGMVKRKTKILVQNKY